MYVYLSAEQSPFETIKDKLLIRLGGELQNRNEDGVRYLHYLNEIGAGSERTIELSKNLLSMSRDVDATEIITRLTPLGPRVESEARETIEDVNGGVAYLDRADLVAKFSIIGKPFVWDDVTIKSNLKAKRIEYLNNQKISLNQYKLGVVDLSLILMISKKEIAT